MDERIEILLLEYTNGSYKENVAAFHSKLYRIYTRVVGTKDIITFLKLVASRPMTSLTKMFIQNLIEVFTANKSVVSFDTYNMVVDDSMRKDTKPFKVIVDNNTTVYRSRASEYIHMLKTIGLVNTIHAIAMLDRIRKDNEIF
jgi:glutaredoxin-related protein